MSKILLLNQPGKIYQKQKSEPMKVLYDARGNAVPIKKKKTVQKYIVHPSKQVRKDFAFCGKHRLFNVLDRMVEMGLVIPYEVTLEV